eukprot:6483051-Amphidinium_carterae.1
MSDSNHVDIATPCGFCKGWAPQHQQRQRKGGALPQLGKWRPRKPHTSINESTSEDFCAPP